MPLKRSTGPVVDRSPYEVVGSIPDRSAYKDSLAAI